MSAKASKSVKLKPGVVTEVAIGQVKPDPDQPRKTFDEKSLAALADNIRERERLAELQRKAEAEAREKADALRRQAEEAEAAGRAAEAAKLAARAEKVEERAAEKVEDLQLREAMVVAPVVPTEAPRVAGIATREVWKFEVTDPALVPREYLVVDEAKIGKVVRALKGDAVIAGVRVWSERQLASSAA